MSLAVAPARNALSQLMTSASLLPSSRNEWQRGLSAIEHMSLASGMLAQCEDCAERCFDRTSTPCPDASHASMTSVQAGCAGLLRSPARPAWTLVMPPAPPAPMPLAHPHLATPSHLASVLHPCDAPPTGFGRRFWCKYQLACEYRGAPLWVLTMPAAYPQLQHLVHPCDPPPTGFGGRDPIQAPAGM